MGFQKKKSVCGFLAGGLFLLTAYTAFGQKSDSALANQQDSRMDWWRKARFGMFIHWGVYAVPAGRYHGKTVTGFYEGKTVPSAGEWIMHDARIPRAEYQQFAKSFNPVDFDADAWVSMAKAAGMKYIVITSKHHDGFALFDSKASDWNVVKATPYGKDIIKQLAEACRKQHMKLGLYYSQANDWNNPGGAAYGGHWDSSQNGSMDDYLRNVAEPQVGEILQNYGEIAELWWDVPSEMTRERAERFLPLLKVQPGIITNDRLGGGFRGDLETPEQFIPATGIPGRDWETCMTMNDTWGFKLDDHHWKSSATLIRNLVDIASKGGNYLLNVGPQADGNFPPPIIERLQAIGKWMNTNGEAIYGTSPGPFRKLDWGRSTRKLNDDGTTSLYLEVFHWPKDGNLKIPGLRNKVISARMLADATSLAAKPTDAGQEIHLPAKAPDTVATVIRLLLEGPLRVDPYTTDASPGGRFSLSADMVDIHNRDATTEEIALEGSDDEKLHIGFWSDPQNWVSWTIRVKTAGTFSVRATVGSPTATDTIRIQIANEHLYAQIRKTGGFHQFREIELGKIKIDHPCIYEVSLRSAADKWEPFNLQEITLTPQ
jgi:alpha-L-fucosidase